MLDPDESLDEESLDGQEENGQKAEQPLLPVHEVGPPAAATGPFGFSLVKRVERVRLKRSSCPFEASETLASSRVRNESESSRRFRNLRRAR